MGSSRGLAGADVPSNAQPPVNHLRGRSSPAIDLRRGELTPPGSPAGPAGDWGVTEGPGGLYTTNWAGNYTYWARRLHRPQSLEELQEVVSAGPRVKVLCSRHSFTGI